MGMVDTRFAPQSDWLDRDWRRRLCRVQMHRHLLGFLARGRRPRTDLLPHAGRLRREWGHNEYRLVRHRRPPGFRCRIHKRHNGFALRAR